MLLLVPVMASGGEQRYISRRSAPNTGCATTRRPTRSSDITRSEYTATDATSLETTSWVCGSGEREGGVDGRVAGSAYRPWEPFRPDDRRRGDRPRPLLWPGAVRQKRKCLEEKTRREFATAKRTTSPPRAPKDCARGRGVAARLPADALRRPGEGWQEKAALQAYRQAIGGDHYRTDAAAPLEVFLSLGARRDTGYTKIAPGEVRGLKVITLPLYIEPVTDSYAAAIGGMGS